MKRLLLVPLIFGVAAPVKAGIYYYPSCQDGIEVRCKDGWPMHLVEISKSGAGLKLEGDEEDQYSWPITYLFPEASDEKYKYFPSTAGTQCSYRKLDEKDITQADYPTLFKGIWTGVLISLIVHQFINH